ncbi:MAG: hypothetical protein LQ350_003788 [Teloschistes chrysophthalmus]|nr:MAG: hypothetical protein LQ350_003788 [Niorma chrysophthalma]
MADDKFSSIPAAHVHENPLLSTIRTTYRSFWERRESLGLSNPGSYENINREFSRDVSLTNFMFAGLRAEWTKPISHSPFFQLSHQLSMGAQAMSPYTFSALYGTSNVFLQGTMENDGSLSARSNYRWSDSLVTKTGAQIQSGQGVLSIENDYTGTDFTASLKAMNPSIIEGGIKGVFIANCLQSVTPSLSLGLEAVWQRIAMNTSPEVLLSYGAKYRGSDWIASLQVQPDMPQGQGSSVNSSYWRKLTDRVSVGADLSLEFTPGMGGQGSLMGGGWEKKGAASAAAKYEFRASTFRAQIDNKGRLSCLLEKTILPAIRVTFAGEMDHHKQQAKVGLGVSVEAMSEELMEQAEKGGIQAPSLPF